MANTHHSEAAGPLLDPFEHGEGTEADLLVGAVDACERLIGMVNALDTPLRDLLTRVETLEGADEADTKVPLEQWATWIRTAYTLSEIPPDWAQIPGAAQEVAALHAAWCAAYKNDSTPKATAAANSWHDSLDRARPRIARFVSDAHMADRTSITAPPWVSDDGVDEVDHDAHHRRTRGHDATGDPRLP